MIHSSYIELASKFYKRICFYMFSCTAFAELLDNALDEVCVVSNCYNMVLASALW